MEHLGKCCQCINSYTHRHLHYYNIAHKSGGENQYCDPVSGPVWTYASEPFSVDTHHGHGQTIDNHYHIVIHNDDTSLPQVYPQLIHICIGTQRTLGRGGGWHIILKVPLPTFCGPQSPTSHIFHPYAPAFHIFHSIVPLPTSCVTAPPPLPPLGISECWRMQNNFMFIIVAFVYDVKIGILEVYNFVDPQLIIIMSGFLVNSTHVLLRSSNVNRNRV